MAESGGGGCTSRRRRAQGGSQDEQRTGPEVTTTATTMVVHRRQESSVQERTSSSSAVAAVPMTTICRCGKKAMCGGVGNGQRRRQHMYGASEKHGDAVDGGPLRSAASVADTGQGVACQGDLSRRRRSSE